MIVGFPVKKDLEFERASGLIKARIEHEGQIFQDVLNLGKRLISNGRRKQTASGVTVKIKNPHRQINRRRSCADHAAGRLGYSVEPTFPREKGFAFGRTAEIILKFETGTFADKARGKLRESLTTAMLNTNARTGK